MLAAKPVCVLAEVVVRAAVGVFVVAMVVLEAVGEFFVVGVLVTVNVRYQYQWVCS